MDDNNLGLPELLAVASVVVFLVASFLTWFDVSIHGDTSGLATGLTFPSKNGWESGFWGFPWCSLPLLFGLALAGLMLAPTLAPGLTLPDLPSWFPVFLGGAAAILVLFKLLIGAEVTHDESLEIGGVSIEVSRGIGIFIAFLATLGMTAAGFLKMQQTATAPAHRPPSPPPPF